MDKPEGKITPGDPVTEGPPQHRKVYLEEFDQILKVLEKNSLSLLARGGKGSHFETLQGILYV